MSPAGAWRLAPACDVTFCEGPHGYHQMDVMGEALAIDRAAMLGLAAEAEVPVEAACRMIERFCTVAGRFSAIANTLCPQLVTADTLHFIQQRIKQNIALLR